MYVYMYIALQAWYGVRLYTAQYPRNQNTMNAGSATPQQRTAPTKPRADPRHTSTRASPRLCRALVPQEKNRERETEAICYMATQTTQPSILIQPCMYVLCRYAVLPTSHARVHPKPGLSYEVTARSRSPIASSSCRPSCKTLARAGETIDAETGKRKTDLMNPIFFFLCHPSPPLNPFNPTSTFFSRTWSRRLPPPSHSRPAACRAPAWACIGQSMARFAIREPPAIQPQS